MNDTVILDFNRVSFSYDSVPVLDSVSFHLHRGEFTVLVGTNGAGKTTVLKLILGLLEPSAGEIVFSTPTGNRTRQNRICTPVRGLRSHLSGNRSRGCPHGAAHSGKTTIQLRGLPGNRPGSGTQRGKRSCGPAVVGPFRRTAPAGTRSPGTCGGARASHSGRTHREHGQRK